MAAWKVLVSSKEKDADALLARLRESGLDAEKLDIAVCDVAFVKDGKTYVQAELKTLRDMIASIGDCRYHEQSASMSESGVPFTFYLIRGCRAGDLTSHEQVSLEHSLTRVQLSASKPQGKYTHIATVYLCR
jgi:ERCC4-type nuclease